MVSLLIAGRLLAASFACGLNTYATIAVLGLASRLGWIDALPPGIQGLENGIIIACATLLFAAETTAGTIPVLEAAWEAVHTLVRPLAAIALAWLVLESATPALQAIGAAAAGATALAAHAAKVGLRLVEIRRRAGRIAIATMEDLVAIGLVFAALMLPSVALGAAVALVALTPLPGLRFWRAAAYGARALAAHVRGFFGDRDFRDPGQMPGGLRALIPPPELGAPMPRAVRATLGAGAWRNGWLVFEGDRASFVYRDLLRSQRIILPTATAATVRPAFLADLLEIQTTDQRLSFLLLKDGPPAATAIGALRIQNGPPAEITASALRVHAG
jgi:hypothetical protein